MKINIYFPIETINRELDYKLVISSMLDLNGNSIVFAQHDLIDKYISFSKNGIYFGKNIMNPLKKKLYDIAKQNNFSIAHLDEEGGVYQGLEKDIISFIDTRLDISYMKKDDAIFTWGQFQKNHFDLKKKELNHEIPIFKTGHFRFELIKPGFNKFYSKDVSSLKKQYGDFILICTTFGFAISPYGYKDTFSKRNGYGVNERKTLRLVEEWNEQLVKLGSFVKLIHYLSKKNPNKLFIIRHHVAEDRNFYKSALLNLTNVKIITEGSSFSWILASKLIIHNGSTTGIEGFLAKKPVINFQTSPNENYDSLIVEKIGKKCATNEEVNYEIKQIFEKKNYSQTNSLTDFDLNVFDNLHDSNHNKMIDKINQMIDYKTKKSKNSKLINLIFIYFIEFINYIIFNLKIPIRIIFFKNKQRKFKADVRSFPGFNKSKLKNILKKIEEDFNVKFSLHYISKRVFIIKRKL